MSCNSFNFNGCFAVPVGFDYTNSLTETDDDEMAIDFTGFDFSMSIQAKNTDVDLLTLSVVGDATTTGIYIPEPTTGEIFIQIRKADSTTVGASDYNYSIRITDPSLNEDLFSYGDISFIGVG
ncbi:MAG: hypothetical protein V3U78_08935 [Thiotrichaceae bacterium]